MALIKCSECAKYVSDKSRVCTRCKAPLVKGDPAANQHEGPKWESAGLFMASTGALALFFFKPPIGLIMVLSGLIVYGVGKFLIGKHI